MSNFFDNTKNFATGFIQDAGTLGSAVLSNPVQALNDIGVGITESLRNATQAAIQGGANKKLYSEYSKLYNVVKDFRWSLNERIYGQGDGALDEVPYIFLREWYVDESTILNQVEYYLSGAGAEAVKNSEDPMSPYNGLFPHNTEGNSYYFPYFDETNFELNTPSWASLDTLEAASKAASSGMGLLAGKSAAEVTQAVIQGGAAAAGAALGAIYPRVGIMDRPKLWQSHDYRTINVKFPLFNTVRSTDWIANRGLCWTLVNQNLFSKVNMVVGVPPVYYELFIPGQHYSYAASMTNLTIHNRGNMRKLSDGNKACIVPDAYEVSMTFTDMVMPSRNLFQQMNKFEEKVSVTR